MPKKYLVFCEWCGFKKIADDSPKEIGGLTPVKTSRVPAGVPQWDATAKKIVEKSAIEVMPKYRCPQCGRAVTAKRLPRPLHEPAPPEKKPDPFAPIEDDFGDGTN